ncbi:MAG: hypothetical protein M3O74_13615 [Pseudomonadota bacterium]|nr:hypothetical protein [Pseudomonadota bacterium]
MTTETTEKPVAFLPPSLSADGARNAFYTQCKELQTRRPYAACQHILNNRSEESVERIYGDCLTAISRGRCCASDMRDEENLKGQAIYFTERVKGAAVVAQQEAWVAPKRGYQRNKYTEGAPAIPAPKAGLRPMSATAATAPKKPAAPVFDGNIYAAALTAAVKKEKNATNAQPLRAPVSPGATAPAPQHPVNTTGAPTNVSIRAGESPLELARRLRASQPI